MRALLSCFVMLSLARSAVADGGAGVVVAGEATLQPQLAAQLERWLRDHGHALVPSPLPPDAINTIIDCFVIEDESCARGVIEKRSMSKTLVFARVEIAQNKGDGTRDVTITGYWFEKGHDAIADRRSCQRCNDDNLRRAADELMTALSRAGQRGVGRLKLTSTPPGAHVTIDGRDAGITPLDFELAPGTHQIEVASDRHSTETRSITIQGGATMEVDVPLVPVEEPPKRSLLAAGLALGGLALVVTGGVLIGVDEDPSPEGPPEFRDTAPLGVACVLGGAVAIGVGAYLWFRGSSSGPVVSASGDGGTVGWFTRF